MRIAHLVAGAGGMYCGACMRDNRLAAKLIQQNHDVVLIPLYMPIRTDEVDVSTRRVYYGGLNVGLQQTSALFRYVPRFLDRLIDSPRLLRALGRIASRVRPADVGRLTVSVLSGEEGAQRKELEKLILALKSLKPTLVHLPNLMFVGMTEALKAALDVPVVCTLAGEDFFLDNLGDPHRREASGLIRRAAANVDAFVAPSQYYAAHSVRHFGLDPERVHHVPMGIRVDDVGEPADPPKRPFTIGYLAGVCPEKGLAELCEAFKILKREGADCRLRVAGYVGAAGRKYWATIFRSLRRDGLGDAVDFVGEVDRVEKIRFLRSLHVLSVPTVHPEPKGFYVLEAMACAVPVVQPHHGSFPELIDATSGGLLHDPGDPRALADAIGTLMNDEAQRMRLAGKGRAAVHANFNDDIMANATWVLYQRYA